MRRSVLVAALVVTLGGATVVMARSYKDLVPSYAPLRRVVKPKSLTLSPSAPRGDIVVKFRRDADIETVTDRLGGPAAARTLAVFRNHNLPRPVPTIPDDPATIRTRRMAAEDRVRMNLPDLSLYFHVSIDSPAVAQAIVAELNALDEVEIASYEPRPEVAATTTGPPPTPSFVAFQTYLDAATDGVGARAAWSLPGGDGTGTRITDIEYGWQLTHEDLSKGASAIILSGNSSTYRDHGTAVLGEMVSDNNSYGVTGIVHHADIGVSSVESISTAAALYNATSISNPGDCILIELHAPGPRYNFQSRDDQLGYIAMEYWQSNFDAIVNAYANGVIVCEAAGNGAEDFDDPIYDSLFTRSFRNSHAIICGAGNPPSGGSPDRSKLGFSNYGSRVDLQGYGILVYTTGYGDLYNGGSSDSWYTGSFGGTSSASPIVTGAVASLSGVFRDMLGVIVDADSLRSLLVATGSPQQQPQLAYHIGPRPNLQAAMDLLFDPVDSIWYGQVDLPIGEQVALPVSLNNSHPVGEIYLPFDLSGPATIFIDSLTRGPRTAGFESVDIVFDNRFNGQAGYLLRADAGGGSPSLPGGSGVIANLWVHTTLAAIPGQVEVVDSAWLGSSTRLRLVSYFDDGYPDYFSPGSITIAPPPCACPLQADLDADGFITAADLAEVIDVIYFSGTDPQDPNCPGTRGDFDCDGTTSAVDLSDLIDHIYFNGPGPCDPCL